MDDIIEKTAESSTNMERGNAYPLYSEEKAECHYPSVTCEATEEILIRIPGVVLSLIDTQGTAELASGAFMLVRLVQEGNVIAVVARVEDQRQWPLVAAIKLDDCHYLFSLRIPQEAYDSFEENSNPMSTETSDIEDNTFNYGLTFSVQGQELALRELDKHLEQYSYFSVQKASDTCEGSSVLGDNLIEERPAVYWRTLAPDVEDYSGYVARGIAAGSGQIIRGLLWCGDVTVEQLRWGNAFLKKRLRHCDRASEISPGAMRRMRRAKRVSKMSENVAVGVLSGVAKIAGFVTESVVNSKAGKLFFNLLPGEIVLASLDAFGKVFDAVEVVGKNVLTTSSVVTTELVSHRYGERAAEFTSEGLGAAGHMIKTAWTISKIRNALNPKSALKRTIAKEAAKTTKKKKRSK